MTICKFIRSVHLYISHDTVQSSDAILEREFILDLNSRRGGWA